MSSKPKRRWFQFSLKSLFVVITLLCIVPGGYMAYEQAKSRRQKAAVEAIQKCGGDFTVQSGLPRRSAMVRQILGDDSFANVYWVELENTQVTDAGLAHLASLRGLMILELSNTPVTDAGLVPLAGLNSLSYVKLDNTQVTDAGLKHLSGLSQLQSLWLQNTKVTDAGLEHLSGSSRLEYLLLQKSMVTDAGVAKLKKALPNCKITR